MSEKYKKGCKILNYFEHVLVFVSAVSRCVSIFAFPSLVGVPAGVGSSVVGTKIWAITAGIKKYIYINKKTSKKHEKIVLLAKTILNTTKVLIFLSLNPLLY